MSFPLEHSGALKRTCKVPLYSGGRSFYVYGKVPPERRQGRGSIEAATTPKIAE